ncbi:ABC transporter substrate-binding protein [Consotaella salsifontis]|uniref:Trehalose/maltose transport system substrate-binding protein n=1 Tax=Consotaella salsifontis TaxID=1365950 RepID=A0A1T4MSS4_9HYPH|nr:ABC transporter substrate-binding protein [Consotaella salsifontis]SJZ69854.1 trehalose/maltose transport system substrate-binding protein [Consotaella salsifontis]
MKSMKLWFALAAGVALISGPASAVELSIVSGATGQDIEDIRAGIAAYEKQTGNTVKIVEMPNSSTDQFGQYRLWLSAGNPDIDVYRTDVVWAPQLAAHFVDLSDAAKDIAGQNIPSIIESQKVEGKLVALPMFADAPALYYRKDLLEKYGMEPPKTWAELEKDAKQILEKEGDSGLNGFVFQGAPYEGLTCNGLEWVASHGGGQIVEPDGEITINNDKAVAALKQAAGWIGTIAPQGVLSYQEEEARGVWQTGKAIFMRNWPYAYALSQSGESAVKDKFAVVPLPAGEGGNPAACLGGYNLAVSKYSRHPDDAVELVKFLTSADAQKDRAIRSAKLPTIGSVYEDPEVAKAQPIVAQWKDVVTNAVARPSAPTKKQYNEVSKDFWTAVNETLAGRGSAEENLKQLDRQLKRLKRGGWE